MNRKEELKKAYLAGFIEGGVAKKLTGIKHHIEDMADDYAEHQIKLTIPIISKQRELLINFLHYYTTDGLMTEKDTKPLNKYIDRYIKKSNL